MFTHMEFIRKDSCTVREQLYDLLVYRIHGNGEYRVFITKNGFGLGDIFTASEQVVSDAKRYGGMDIISELLVTAKDDIVRNEFGCY